MCHLTKKLLTSSPRFILKSDFFLLSRLHDFRLS
uniref:Uncharacterized protein n=1 Tax=Arundo donax TaxID=35708 RepID=A0A0A9BI66_ARUDO